MNIENLTIAQVREIAALFSAQQAAPAQPVAASADKAFRASTS